jgi:hypothetical protein
MSCFAIRPGTSLSGTHWVALDSKRSAGALTSIAPVPPRMWWLASMMPAVGWASGNGWSCPGRVPLIVPAPLPFPDRRRTVSRPGSVKGCPEGRRQAPLTGSGRRRQ